MSIQPSKKPRVSIGYSIENNTFHYGVHLMTSFFKWTFLTLGIFFVGTFFILKKILNLVTKRKRMK